MPAYARPTRIDDALKLLARGGRTVLAGGTDFYPARVGKPLGGDVLDLTALPQLRGIVGRSDHWRIGATTTWAEVIAAKLPPIFDCLKLAAREVGGQQIQNTGTVAGNLCNASPAADGVPPLLALDASVEVASTDGVRALPLAQFIIGPRKTVLAPNEIVTAILVPKTAHEAKSGFLKLGARKYLVISIAMVAAVIEHEAGVVRAARIAVGACSPVAKRLPDLEQHLVGKRLDADLADCIKSEHLGALSAIDDLRGSAAYRIEAVQVLLRRLLAQMA
ncbi:MAG: xanthine dehydrogenase [Betaproteobacteria bacterium RIFCSPLOWO2_12_FULL_67_28]|nr:MAG: xanthine dehydrogenase [Betaproteobacteria bacterium RIFCSPLOWO2_12_FULL_67_28]